MQEREFWQLVEEVFGRSYGRALAQDQELTGLEDLTAVEALKAGEEPRVVWVCAVRSDGYSRYEALGAWP